MNKRVFEKNTVEKYLQDILTAINPKSLSVEQKDKVASSLRLDLHKAIALGLISNLSSDDQRQFADLLRQTKETEEIVQYFKNKIQDVDEKCFIALDNFKKDFLQTYSSKISTNN